MNGAVSETNWQRCLRLAHEIEKDDLIRELIKALHEKELRKKSGTRRPLWSVVGEAVGHGSGVSSAIVEIYYPEGAD